MHRHKSVHGCLRELFCCIVDIKGYGVSPAHSLALVSIILSHSSLVQVNGVYMTTQMYSYYVLLILTPLGLSNPRMNLWTWYKTSFSAHYNTPVHLLPVFILLSCIVLLDIPCCFLLTGI